MVRKDLDSIRLCPVNMGSELLGSSTQVSQQNTVTSN